MLTYSSTLKFKEFHKIEEFGAASSIRSFPHNIIKIDEQLNLFIKKNPFLEIVNMTGNAESVVILYRCDNRNISDIDESIDELFRLNKKNDE